MKKYITPPYLGFTATALLLTVAVRFCISTFLDLHAFEAAIFSSFVYGILIFAAGWWFGSRDAKHLPVYDIGFRFHLTTFVVYLGISYLWFALGFNSPMDKVSDILSLTVIVWGIAVFVHFVFFLSLRRRSIRGLDKKKLFE